MTKRVNIMWEVLVGSSKTPAQSRDALWTYHTVHIHGHDFYTMSIGHPVTDEITGRITGLAPGVECDNEGGFLIDVFYTLHDSGIN